MPLRCLDHSRNLGIGFDSRSSTHRIVPTFGYKETTGPGPDGKSGEPISRFGNAWRLQGWITTAANNRVTEASQAAGHRRLGAVETTISTEPVVEQIDVAIRERLLFTGTGDYEGLYYNQWVIGTLGQPWPTSGLIFPTTVPIP